MELLTKLPVQACECIRSYAIRLALANDYDTMTRFFNETSHSKKLSINSSQKNITKLVKSLDERLKQQSFLPATQQIKAAIGIKFMMHEVPHVCPHCLVERDGIKAKWQLLQFTHCDIHHCEIIRNCHCGKPFEWNETLLSYGCSHCLLSWSEIAGHIKSKSLPAHVKHFALLSFDEREIFLEDMMTAAIRALRPFDSVHHKLKMFRHCKVDWSKLMAQSFNMLSDSSTIIQWRQNLAFKRRHFNVLGDNAVFYPIVSLQERLHSNWLIKGYNLKSNEVAPSSALLSSHSFTLCNARNCSASEESTNERVESQLINQVDQVAFMKMTGVNIDTARTFFKMNFITVLSKFGRGRYTFIEIDSFVGKLKTMNSLSSMNTVAISKLKGMLSTYCLSLEDVSIEIINENLPVYLNPKAVDFVSSLHVNELQLIDFLESKYINNNNFSLTHTAKLLRIPRDKVKRLCRMNLLKELPSPNGQYLYSGVSISQFLVKYECLERWAEIHNLCLGKVLKEVVSEGITPLFSPFVFEKSTTLTNLLNTLHGNQWYHPEQLTLAM